MCTTVPTTSTIPITIDLGREKAGGKGGRSDRSGMNIMPNTAGAGAGAGAIQLLLPLIHHNYQLLPAYTLLLIPVNIPAADAAIAATSTSSRQLPARSFYYFTTTTCMTIVTASRFLRFSWMLASSLSQLLSVACVRVRVCLCLCFFVCVCVF